MTEFLDILASRRRFGMKPGLDTITRLCDLMDNPNRRLGKVIHIAGTNGKGAVSAMLDAALENSARYTSPHLVRINERFFLRSKPIDDATLDRAAAAVYEATKRMEGTNELTFFEALTAVAFKVYSEAELEWTILECGLGGRLDATNVCEPALCVITKIGLDHCDWLGTTVEQIAAEKAGIIKRGVPIVLARNDDAVREVIESRARELGAPFYYAPELVSADDVPFDLSLRGSFNRENARTAIAALKVLGQEPRNFNRVVWPGRFQQVGRFLVDGAHNPPAARALSEAISEEYSNARFNLIFGACGDKDAKEVIAILRPHLTKAFAVKTNNPRSLSSHETVELIREVGLDAVACDSLEEAIDKSSGATLICGSLFLAGEALVSLGAFPWCDNRFDPSEMLRTS